MAHQLFEMKFGGINNFADAWAHSDRSRMGSDSSPRSAKTIYAWLKNGLPTTRETLFSFFAALDVDPVSLIDLDRNDLRSNFGRLRHAFMLGGMNAGGFKALFELFRPCAIWPDTSLAESYYARDWTRFDFVHAAAEIINTYATITVQGDNSVDVLWPRAFHIAYRRQSNADGLWRPYGTVVSRFSEAILVHENGDIQRMSMPARSSHQLGPVDKLIGPEACGGDVYEAQIAC